MALATFSIANVLFSFTALDERRSIFSMETFSDRKFLYASGLSIAAIVLGTEMDVLNRILQTVSLTRTEWLICLLVPLTVVAASELWKLFLRSRSGGPEHNAEPVAVPAGSTSAA
jgi:Ca2+-transporting ATPase